MYKVKNVEFACVTSYKVDGPNELEPYVYVTCTDKSFHVLKGFERGDGPLPVGKRIIRYEQSVNVSQIALLDKRRAIFTSVDEKDRPGSIQVIQGDLSDKKQIDETKNDRFEIQAHSLAVTRLKLSYDN